MTNRELIRALRQPGRVYMPVLIPNDVKSIEVVKADVIEILRDLPGDDEAYWCIYQRFDDAIRLDLA
jgi:hypothetical protein